MAKFYWSYTQYKFHSTACHTLRREHTQWIISHVETNQNM